MAKYIPNFPSRDSKGKILVCATSLLPSGKCAIAFTGAHTHFHHYLKSVFRLNVLPHAMPSCLRVSSLDFCQDQLLSFLEYCNKFRSNFIFISCSVFKYNRNKQHKNIYVQNMSEEGNILYLLAAYKKSETTLNINNAHQQVDFLLEALTMHSKTVYASELRVTPV